MSCKSFFLLLAVLLVLCNPLYADTIPGGYVSGIWYQANSPYYITGNITIPADSTLYIEPGVQVKFFSTYIFLINGFLEAVGNESDSIHFAPDTSASSWRGLCFDGAADNSHLDYCSISGVGGITARPILCQNSSDPIISHCRITGTAGTSYPNIEVADNSNPSISNCVITGGINGIYWNSGASNPIISGCTISNCTRSAVLKQWGNLTLIDCTIIDNTSINYDGGGIRSMNQNLTLNNCTISNNYSGGSGGGIYCVGGSHTLVNCKINGNWSASQFPPYIGGGGVCLDNDANGSLSHCAIYDNFADAGGGGITISGTGSLTIDHCTIDGNAAGNGSGMWLEGSPTTDVANSIISNNKDGYGIYNEDTLTVEYTDFYGNELGAIGSTVPAGFGVLDTVNYNGDSCDVYYNIFLDPMFADVANRDFHLTWANFPAVDSTKSPCIDAGDTLFTYDPDSTITDMGAYYFDQRPPEIELSISLLDFDSITVGDSSSQSFNVYNVGEGNLILRDISNSLSVFMNYWNSTDSLILPGDSLEITVTFKPDDTLDFNDTLWIDNNDTPAYVELMGIGKPVSGIEENVTSLMLEICGTNPFYSHSVIRFGLPNPGKITLSIYDITGRCVKPLANGEYQAGIHEITFDGIALSQGVYFCVMKAGKTSLRQKLIMLK